jgi:hypothetical protein
MRKCTVSINHIAGHVIKEHECRISSDPPE